MGLEMVEIKMEVQERFGALSKFKMTLSLDV